MQDGKILSDNSDQCAHMFIMFVHYYNKKAFTEKMRILPQTTTPCLKNMTNLKSSSFKLKTN